MFDKSIGPSFAKVYYEKYMENPTALSTLYSENAVFSHSDIKKGKTDFIRDCYGISQINAELEAINDKRPKTKVAILHIDSMPTGNDAVTILVGGYLLQETGPSRFVQNFILQGSEGNNNYVVVNDCLRVYEKKTRTGFTSLDDDASQALELRLQGKNIVEPSKADQSQNLEKSAPQQTNQAAKNKPDANHHDAIHASWCDEIEREEEELRQQKKKDQANHEIIDKSMSVVGIVDRVKATDLENVTASNGNANGEAKSFSYAAAAKRAPPSGDDKKHLGISVTKNQGADGENAEPTKDKKNRKNSKHDSQVGSRSPLDNASQDEKARVGKYKQRSKNFRRPDGSKKTEGKAKEEIKGNQV